MTPPTLPQPTIEDSRSFYTMGQMRAHHRAWGMYVKSLNIVEDESDEPVSQPSKPRDPGVAALFKAFGIKQ